MSCHRLPTELSSSPPGPYHQEPYVSKPEERFKAPPILPPHLLQVILNKDTGISVSTQASVQTILHRPVVPPLSNCLSEAVGKKVSVLPVGVNCQGPPLMWERATGEMFQSVGAALPLHKAFLNLFS